MEGFMESTTPHRSWISAMYWRSAIRALAIMLAGAVMSAPRAGAQTYTETVLFGFSQYANGSNPVAGLTLDPVSNLYGTAPYRGNFDIGMVSELHTAGTLPVPYSFSDNGGWYPASGVVRASAGNLY